MNFMQKKRIIIFTEENFLSVIALIVNVVKVVGLKKHFDADLRRMNFLLYKLTIFSEKKE